MRSPLRLLAFALTLLVGAPTLADDGDLDGTFAGGTLTIDWGEAATATAIEILRSGDAIVGGTLSDPGRWAISKVWENGAIDLDWSGGFVPFGFGNEGASEVLDLFALHHYGTDRVMAAGWVEISPGLYRPALARLLWSGGLDPGFDGNGLDIVSPLPAGWTGLRVGGAAFLPDGRSVFVGSCEDCPTPDVDQLFVARRLWTGAPDTTFSGDGWMSFVVDADDSSVASCVTIDASGAIFVGGESVTTNALQLVVAKVTPAGELDLSFGGGDGLYGPVSYGSFPLVHQLAVDPNSGRVALAVSELSAVPLGGEVHVLTAAGELDATFSGNGRISLDLEEGADIVSVVFQSDEKLLAVGTIDANGPQNGGFLLARLTAAGQFDDSFDDNGVKRVEFDFDRYIVDRGLAATTWGGRLFAVGFSGAGNGDDQSFALLRTESALIFRNGFEGVSTLAWPGR